MRPQGRRAARVRRRGGMVSLSAGTVAVGPDRSARRATIPRHRSLLAPAGARYPTPSGRTLFGMLGVFSEFERAMIRDRVMAGLDRARSSGKRLGRPRTTPFQVQRIRLALDEGSRCARDGKAAEGIRRQGQRGAAHVGDLGRSASLIGRLQSEPTRSPYYELNLPSHMADGRRCRILLKSTCHENTYKEVIPSRTTDPSRCSSRNWGCA